ncbi:MAG: sugar phosphate nucleotidyltransferase [Promethearchaeota archaeon]
MSIKQPEIAIDDIKKLIGNKADLLAKEMYGIISAGGEGVRLRPITLELPKPMIEIGATKKPIMYWSLLPMILGGVSHFIIGVRYGASKIIEFFGTGEKLSKEFDREIIIDYIQEHKPLGRAGFIKDGIEQDKIKSNKPAIIFNASDILRLNLHKLLIHYLWLKTSYDIDVVQIYTSGFRVQYGMGEIDPSTSRVINFKEKPIRQGFASTACYVIHKCLSDFKTISKIPSNPEDELIHKWIKEKKIGGYVIPHESLISIKFEKDLVALTDADIDQYVKQVYSTNL